MARAASSARRWAHATKVPRQGGRTSTSRSDRPSSPTSSRIRRRFTTGCSIPSHRGSSVRSINRARGGRSQRERRTSRTRITRRRSSVRWSGQRWMSRSSPQIRGRRGRCSPIAYRVGRLFIVGDAAHQNPPWGGHGFNTGVGDAVNLGWKLAAVEAGWAPDALLDSYGAERRPIEEQTIALASSNMAALSIDLSNPLLMTSGETFEIRARGTRAGHLAGQVARVLQRGSGARVRVRTDLARAGSDARRVRPARSQPATDSPTDSSTGVRSTTCSARGSPRSERRMRSRRSWLRLQRRGIPVEHLDTDDRGRGARPARSAHRARRRWFHRLVGRLGCGRARILARGQPPCGLDALSRERSMKVIAIEEHMLPRDIVESAGIDLGLRAGGRAAAAG